MFQVHLFTFEAEETLTRMQIQIRDVGHEIMPQQLETWQIEDMHRRYPNIDKPDYVSAETTIWPRSRTYERTHAHRETRAALFKQKNRPLSPLPRVVGVHGKPGTSSARPILRPALFAKLIERMTEMMAVNLKWVTSHTKGATPPTSGPDALAQARRDILTPSNYKP